MKKKHYTTTDVKSVANLIINNPQIPTKELQDICYSNGILHGEQHSKSINWQYLKKACQKVLGIESLVFTGGTRFSKVSLALTTEEVDQKILDFGGLGKEICISVEERKTKVYLPTPEKVVEIETQQTEEERRCDAMESLKAVKAILAFMDDPEKGDKSKKEISELCSLIERLQRRSLKNMVIETYIEARKKAVDELREEFL